ncbi:hypothetical protein SISSUDRAFT_1127684 [Sistotremastrum suecicum HHB10207 ss-3]|uniref:F-box domain-containing protein n=1 Tax=Sistotremastrum suecicum HHB10207 ss-3 TaxID=1314776 RepID=A0A166EUT6_9AGAM|nr:hypothetical protein SISSUDRAFT_1127684 [Sistotremastrum suecicum HHB10207 ss-3]
MSITKLDDGILLDIIRLTKRCCLTWQDNLSTIQTFHLVNKRFQPVATKACLWSDLDLRWPQELLDFYMQKSRNHSLALTLRIEGLTKVDCKAQNRKYSDYLTRCLPMTKKLDIYIAVGQCTRELANALNNAAPRLETLHLELDKGVALIKSLFAYDAPLLVTALVHDPVSHDLPRFPSLRTLNLRVGKAHHQNLLVMLETMPQLEDITLVGERSAVQTDLLQPYTGSIFLPSCRSFKIRSMQISVARQIVSHLNFLSTATLDMQLFVSHNDVSLSNREPSFDPFILSPDILANVLTVELLPDSLLLQLDSSPSYSFTLDLHSFHATSTLGSKECRLRILAGVIEFLVGSMSAHVTQLLLSCA